MKTIIIPIDDGLDDVTVARLEEVLRALARTEWAMLLKFYTAQRFEVHCKGGEVDVKAMVWK